MQKDNCRVAIAQDVTVHLNNLARQVRDAHQAVSQAAGDLLANALACGDVLIAAKEREGPGIYRAVGNIAALNKRDAAWLLADQIIDGMIDARRRDPAIPPRSFVEWPLAFANLRLRLSEQLADEMIGLVDLDTVLNAIEAEL